MKPFLKMDPIKSKTLNLTSVEANPPRGFFFFAEPRGYLSDRLSLGYDVNSKILRSIQHTIGP